MEDRERKLATIQRILSLEPIPEADLIEKATVLGWHLVVRKGDFKVGNLCIYCEIDSILPEKPEFEFLRERKFRIKTIKLKGQISQGICFPLNILPKDFPTVSIDEIEGLDVTEVLSIKKYDPEEHVPACLRGKVKGNFPGFLRKTDEPRIQGCPGVLERNRNKKFYVTEKLDGTSVTYFVRNGEFGICSRKMWLKEDEKENKKLVYVQIAEKLELEKRLIDLNVNIAIQGEIVGPGIQKNKYKLEEYQLFVFNGWLIDEQRYMNYLEFSELCGELGLETVPFLGHWILSDEIMVGDLVEMSKGKSVLIGIKREGIVIRSIIEDVDPKIGRLSFKCVNPDFLLKHGE